MAGWPENPPKTRGRKDRGVYPHVFWRLWGDSVLVTRTQSIDIRADIDSADGSFRGELSNEDGASRSFSGWTEFATALMALARDTDDPTRPNIKIEEKTQ